MLTFPCTKRSTMVSDSRPTLTLDLTGPDGNVYKVIVLAIVNSHVRLIDRSGLYPEYAWDEAAITAAVKHLNEQLSTLPDTVTCAVEEVYPEFDLPELSPVRYLAMVEEELAEVDEKIEMTEEGQQEPLQRLRSMLQ